MAISRAHFMHKRNMLNGILHLWMQITEIDFELPKKVWEKGKLQHREHRESAMAEKLHRVYLLKFRENKTGLVVHVQIKKAILQNIYRR
ncbi:MAG: hypothetical protein Q8M29_10585 [Bacteroidota bacterium]|nr:hypothetical protein [Bacteroidota bacterium]